jgi:hypothetical protein
MVGLSRMLIAACLAYLWIITQGIFVLANKQANLIDRTDRVDKSLFRLGLYDQICFEEKARFRAFFSFSDFRVNC